jgi:hypothetical protein
VSCDSAYPSVSTTRAHAYDSSHSVRNTSDFIPIQIVQEAKSTVEVATELCVGGGENIIRFLVVSCFIDFSDILLHEKLTSVHPKVSLVPIHVVYLVVERT